MDNIIGMVTSKSFFQLMSGMYRSFSDIVQHVLYVSETSAISDVLRQMQQSKIHMAIVVDQYGGTRGIVTLEDVLEELVGDIYDESDEVIPPISQTAPHQYTILGACSLGDLEDFLDDSDDQMQQEADTAATSVGGWVTELLEHIPAPGEQVLWNRYQFTVLEADNQSVQKVQLIVLPKPESTQSEKVLLPQNRKKPHKKIHPINKSLLHRQILCSRLFPVISHFFLYFSKIKETNAVRTNAIPVGIHVYSANGKSPVFIP